MGAWSSEIFGNDNSCDWTYDLEETSDISLISSSIEKIYASDDYIESYFGDECLAAIDTITRLRGHFHQKDAYTESVDNWVLKNRLVIPEELIKKSFGAIQKIYSEKSELFELWSEGGISEEWKEEIENLKKRLALPQIELPEYIAKEEFQEIKKPWWKFW